VNDQLSCAECGRCWCDESEPRWRAVLCDDGSGATVFYCCECWSARQQRTLPIYSLQLVGTDGRWNVAETRLAAPPRPGDVIRVGGDAPWQVCESRQVPVRPAGKPPRQFFVCRPAALAA
jgi:hypothetical protein